MSALALSSNTRTHARPAAFASYIAMSALRRITSADSFACSAKAMPMLAVTRSSRPPISKGTAHAASTCWATIFAPARSTPSHTTTNSSPPSRATGSVDRTAPTNRRATATRSASPMPWPRLSFTTLKWSTSTKSTASERPPPIACSTARLRICRNCARFGSSVRRSCVASYVSASWNARRSVTSRPLSTMPPTFGSSIRFEARTSSQRFAPSARSSTSSAGLVTSSPAATSSSSSCNTCCSSNTTKSNRQVPSIRDGGTARRRWIDGVTNWTNPAGSTIAITSEERRTSDAKRAADFRISSSLTRASAMASPAMLSARRRLCTSTRASDPASKLSSTPPTSTTKGAVADGVGNGASELTRTVNRSPSASTSAVRTSEPRWLGVSSNVDGATPTNAVVLSSGPPSKRLSPSVCSVGRCKSRAKRSPTTTTPAHPLMSARRSSTVAGVDAVPYTGVTTTIARGIVREAMSVLILPTESGIVLDAMGRPESREHRERLLGDVDGTTVDPDHG